MFVLWAVRENKGPERRSRPSASTSSDGQPAGCPAPDWKRPPGRPRKTWIQQVEADHGSGAQSTHCGHRCRITRCGGRYGPRWSSTAVSELMKEKGGWNSHDLIIIIIIIIIDKYGRRHRL